MSQSSRDEVSTTTGILLVRGSDLIRFSTSRPSTLGSFKSSRISLGLFSILRCAYAPVQKMKSSASAPSRTTSIRLLSLLPLKEWSANSLSLGLSSTNKISTTVSVIADITSKGKVERCSFVNFCFGPNATPMTVNDPLHNS